MGAPHAIQVADRFHLMKNLAEARGRVLVRTQRVLRQTAEAVRATLHSHQEEPYAALSAAPSSVPLMEPPPPLTRTPGEQARTRAALLALATEVQGLHHEGVSIAAIARRLHLSRPTVRTYVQADGRPERAVRPSLLAPFEPYLWQRWTAGCQNAALLWQEIRAQGFRGSYPHLRLALQRWPTGPAARGPAAQKVTPAPDAAPIPLRLFSPRQAVWLLLQAEADHTPDEHTFVAHLTQVWPASMALRALAQAFSARGRTQHAGGLAAWLRDATRSAWPQMHRFAAGLRRDRVAVDAGLTLPWSQGQAEGHVNRLKLLKRRGYGRSGFDLLRQRVLQAS